MEAEAAALRAHTRYARLMPYVLCLMPCLTPKSAGATARGGGGGGATGTPAASGSSRGGGARAAVAGGLQAYGTGPPPHKKKNTKNTKKEEERAQQWQEDFRRMQQVTLPQIKQKHKKSTKRSARGSGRRTSGVWSRYTPTQKKNTKKHKKHKKHKKSTKKAQKTHLHRHSCTCDAWSRRASYYCYICVLILLLYICPHTATHAWSRRALSALLLLIKA